MGLIDWDSFLYTTEFNVVAYAAAIIAVLISTFHIFSHLRNYSMPQIQAYVVRILLICPIFSVSSALALRFPYAGHYIIAIRDIYEAVVVYSFLNLILEFCGGETDCVYQIESKVPLKMPFPLCFLQPKQLNAVFMRFCCRGVLQFVLIKPVVSLAEIIVIATDTSDQISWKLIRMIIYNISYTFALYCLYVFYLATKSIIKSFRPVSKFFSVKGIIFATYYQSMCVALINESSSRVTEADATRWNNSLICIEMVFFSICLLLAFPVKEFLGGLPDRSVFKNAKDVFTVRDVVQNVIHNFSPAYKDYALQRSQQEAPNVGRLKTYFSGNMNSTALEMAGVYRGKSRRIAFNNLLRGDHPVRAHLRRSNPFSSKTDLVAHSELFSAESADEYDEGTDNPNPSFFIHSNPSDKESQDGLNNRETTGLEIHPAEFHTKTGDTSRSSCNSTTVPLEIDNSASSTYNSLSAPPTAKIRLNFAKKLQKPVTDLNLSTLRRKVPSNSTDLVVMQTATIKTTLSIDQNIMIGTGPFTAPSKAESFSRHMDVKASMNRVNQTSPIFDTRSQWVAFNSGNGDRDGILQAKADSDVNNCSRFSPASFWASHMLDGNCDYCVDELENGDWILDSEDICMEDSFGDMVGSSANQSTDTTLVVEEASPLRIDSQEN